MKALLPIYVKAQSWFHAKRNDEKGATMVEYALMVALVAAATIGVVQLLQQGVAGTFTDVTNAM